MTGCIGTGNSVQLASSGIVNGTDGLSCIANGIAGLSGLVTTTLMLGNAWHRKFRGEAGSKIKARGGGEGQECRDCS